MSILGRLIKRNILRKPLRSFSIIIALAASAFALLFCIAGREAPEQAMRQQILAAYGGSELLVIDTKYDLKLDKKDFPKDSVFFMVSSKEVRAKSPKGEYSANLSTYDTEAGTKLGLCDSKYETKKGVIISEAFSRKTGLNEGDTVTVTVSADDKTKNAKGKTVSLKVEKVSSDKYMRRKTSTLFVSMQTFRSVLGLKGTGYRVAMVDLPDETDVMSFTTEMQQKYSAKNYTFSPLLTDDVLDDLGKQTMVFYLIFAVILLMTLFLTFSMSRHIANERLSTIGTLRSIGGSIPKTSTLLIIESSVYGLIGGIIGSVAFVFCGEFAVSAFFGNTSGYSIPLWLYPLAVLLAVAIQIICQSGALIKAVRTPVRDIIFSTRDTAYVLSIKKLIIGAVLLTAGTVIGIISDSTVPSIAAITLICVGSVMVVPIVIKLISKLFVKLFAVLGMPTAKFAANECSHKKSTVTSTQLTFIALAITTAVFIISSAIADTYSTDYYRFDAEIEINKKAQECEYLTKLPEIKESEKFMSTYMEVSVNGGKARNVFFIAYSDFKLRPIVTGIGKEPASDEIYIGSDLAKKLDVKAGDTIDVVDTIDYIIKEDGTQEHPQYKFRIKALCDTVSEYKNAFILNRKWYQDNISKFIDSIFVKLSTPGSIETLREKVERDFPNADVFTSAELIAENDEDCSRIMTIIYSILGVGIVLALLGAVSNAVIGFEQSKRKYAVLHSVAAGKKKLSKLILTETLFSSLTAGVLASLLGLLLTAMVGATLENTGISIVIEYNVLAILAFILVLVAALMLAAVKPIVSLRKMNTAAELKYE